MIKLEKRSMSVTLNHTGGDVGTTYMINHGLATDRVKVEVMMPDAGNEQTIMTDYFLDAPSNWGYYTFDITPETLSVRLFRFYPPGPAQTANSDFTVYVETR